MKLFSRIGYFGLALLFCAYPAVQADIFQWSNSEIQYLHGSGYRNPGNPRDIDQSIITITHAHGWALGHNFFFMDTLFTEKGQPSQTNLYGEAYSYLSLSKISGHDLSWGIFKDFNIAGGVNIGENMDSDKSGSRVILYGGSVDFNLPGFKLFSVDILCHEALEPVATGSSWQITPVWKLPFTIGGTQWSLEGFSDFISKKHGTSAYSILAQPQLRLDVGDLFGYSGHLYAGVEYQYWHNKFGIKGLHEHVPQALILWKF